MSKALRYDITVAVSLFSFSLRTLNAIDVYGFITYMFYCRRKSFEYLNSPKFQFVKSRILSD